MLYKTTCAIAYKGERVEKGREIEFSEEEAQRYGDDLVAVNALTLDPEPEEVKPLEKMTKKELEAHAESLGLPSTGTVADLRERITLHLEALKEN